MKLLGKIGLGILYSLFILVMLTIGALLFISDANQVFGIFKWIFNLFS
jgi:hypothetical protein